MAPPKGQKRKAVEQPGSSSGSAAGPPKPDAATLALVQKKLSENFKCLNSDEMDILQNPLDSLTLRAKLTKDTMAKKAG